MKLLPIKTLAKTNKSVQVSLRSQKTLKHKHQNVLKVAILSTYPPRECGIAAFSHDLEKSLVEKFGDSIEIKIYALETDNPRQYPKDQSLLDISSGIDCACVATELNSDDDLDVVLIQHEFGLFVADEAAFLKLLRAIAKPIVVTFHTVLPNPDNGLLRKVQSIVSAADRIIVMTSMSADLLENHYALKSERIIVIPHGTHLVMHRNRAQLKEKYKLAHRKVLSTFGLIGPGKSIETTLEALPWIINKNNDVVFLIIGKTHPSLLKAEGEAYRKMLKRRVTVLGLQNHVRFIDKFLPLPQLLEYLQLTDVYLFTSKDPNQAVSGTFSYALSCGCPVVSTPIPHALELYKKNACVLFDFGNSKQLFETVTEQLRPNDATQQMIINGLQFTTSSCWENSAVAHANLFKTLTRKPRHLKFTIPPISLCHVSRMTTEVGITQFSRFDCPDPDSGYTLDDNARALICACEYYSLSKDPNQLPLIRIYFNFIMRCFRYNGCFLNYVDKNMHFTNQNFETNLEDANGRALWALGYLLSRKDMLPASFHLLVEKAERLFNEACEHARYISSPRALAFVIKGLYHHKELHTKNECHDLLIEEFADRLAQIYLRTSSDIWKWYENSITYGNAVMPQAMLLVYWMSGKEQYKLIAKESFDFLLSRLFYQDTFRAITNKGWLNKGESPTTETGGEQPIDVAYSILALASFHQAFPTKSYNLKLQRAFNWFLGDNSLNQTVYNPCTAGCYDGIEEENINLNQGAESTLCYLLARMVLESKKTI